MNKFNWIEGQPKKSVIEYTLETMPLVRYQAKAANGYVYTTEKLLNQVPVGAVVIAYRNPFVVSNLGNFKSLRAAKMAATKQGLSAVTVNGTDYVKTAGRWVEVEVDTDDLDMAMM